MHTDLMEVKELFDKIANTSGKNDKIKIIKQNKDNELFVECLKFLLDSVKLELEKEYIIDMIKSSSSNLTAVDYQSIYYILSIIF